MTPVLFNLYTCLVVERWLNVDGEMDVGIVAHYKYDHCLFRRNALERLFTDCLFADDGALLASTRSGVACMYQQVSKNFGLTVSIPKTKHMTTGRLTDDSERDPIALEGGGVESVNEFPYLGSAVASSGRMDENVGK